MILAAGLTPAWQQVYEFDRFHAGDVNRAARVEHCASGKVVNVGVALHLLGRDSRVLSVVGHNQRATLDADLEGLGVSRRWVETAADTRTCTTILERQTSDTTELVENAGELNFEELANFKAAFAEEVGGAEFAVLTGSLPAGTPANYYADLLDHARCPVLLDVRGPELLPALERRPLVVKPNRDELAATVGRPLKSDADLLAAMAELNDRGAEWVVVSEGSKSVWLRGGGGVFQLEPPRLTRVINPIGCGDVLAAGIAAAVVDGRDLLESVRFGIAAAAESALELLPARLNAANVRKRMASIEASQIE